MKVMCVVCGFKPVENCLDPALLFRGYVVVEENGLLAGFLEKPHGAQRGLGYQLNASGLILGQIAPNQRASEMKEEIHFLEVPGDKERPTMLFVELCLAAEDDTEDNSWVAVSGEKCFVPGFSILLEELPDGGSMAEKYEEVLAGFRSRKEEIVELLGGDDTRLCCLRRVG